MAVADVVSDTGSAVDTDVNDTDGGDTDTDTDSADTDTDSADTDTDSTDTGSVDTGGDTGLVDTGDTGLVDTGLVDTGDTGLVDTGDTGLVDTGDPAPTGSPTVQAVELTCTSSGCTVSWQLDGIPADVRLEGDNCTSGWGGRFAATSVSADWCDSYTDSTASSSATSEACDYWTLSTYDEYSSVVDCVEFSVGSIMAIHSGCYYIATSTLTCTP